MREDVSMKKNPFILGVIEGFYGIPWSWNDRLDYVDFLKEHQFGLYIYGPKEDFLLRENWRKPYTEQGLESLKRLSDAYHKKGLEFGIAFSPFQAYLDWGPESRRQLLDKIEELNQVDADLLCILFDDMKGDIPGLADLQVEICNYIAEESSAHRFIMCPTYYSYDPILEGLFGPMPENYLEDLGKQLDKRFDIFWTGPEVWAVPFEADHLIEVGEKLRRKPLFWDNYPVNDVKNWCYLFLEPFKNRLHQMEELTSGHLINPMNQALLSRIPLATLSDLYRFKEQYNPEESFKRAVRNQLPPKLAEQLILDHHDFHHKGMNQFSKEQKAEYIQYYSTWNNPYAREVTEWLMEKWENKYNLVPNQ